MYFDGFAPSKCRSGEERGVTPPPSDEHERLQASGNGPGNIEELSSSHTSIGRRGNISCSSLEVSTLWITDSRLQRVVLQRAQTFLHRAHDHSDVRIKRGPFVGERLTPRRMLFSASLEGRNSTEQRSDALQITLGMRFGQRKDRKDGVVECGDWKEMF